MMLSLVLSLSRPSRSTGDAQGILQGEPGAGDRGLGSLTPFLGPGRFMPSPCTFLIRSPMPLAHDVLGESLTEPQALLRGLEKGQHDPLFRLDGGTKHHPRFLLRRRT